MAGQDKAHLSQKKLAEIEGMERVISDLLAFLEGAKFEPGRNENTKNCADDGLPIYVEPLLKKLGLSLSKYNILRITGPDTLPVTSKNGDIVSISSWGNQPTLEGKVLAPRTLIHFTEGVSVKVEAESGLNILMIAAK